MGATVPENESSREGKFRRTFVPRSERAWALFGQGVKGPGALT